VPVAFTATYNFPFKQTILTGVLQNATLTIESFNRFTDGSGRSSYFTVDTFKQA
jgi:hypothetical protein